MTGTNVPQVTWNGATGFVPPQEADVLVGVSEDINSAFGGDLTQAPETPQGQLASSEAAIVSDFYDQFVFYTTQTDPAFAVGRMQDAIGRIYFLERNPAQSTTVQATCSGAVNTIIPGGSIAVDTAGNQYVSMSTATIPISGSVVVSFAAIQTGPIPCPTGSLSTIYSTIPGWDSITNASNGVEGTDVESAAAFEARRSASVAINALGILPAVRGAVLAVPGVTDAYVYDNSTNSPATVLGQIVAANSLYVCVAGGASAAIAQAIWTKKPPGCSYTGSTTVTVYDTNSGYNPPYPSYAVSYQIPSSLEIVFAVSIKSSAQVPGNAAALIQAAILAAFSGADGGARATIGSLLLASRYYAGIANLGAWAQIVSLQIGSLNSPGATFTGAISGTTLTTSGVTGTIAIGQTVQGANVLDGTVILSGSGSSWVVSVSQTVASETMYGVTAGLNSIQVNINQVPTTAAADITVTTV